MDTFCIYRMPLSFLVTPESAFPVKSSGNKPLDCTFQNGLCHWRILAGRQKPLAHKSNNSKRERSQSEASYSSKQKDIQIPSKRMRGDPGKGMDADVISAGVDPIGEDKWSFSTLLWHRTKGGHEQKPTGHMR